MIAERASRYDWNADRGLLKWSGIEYRFRDKSQIACVSILYEAWLRGEPDVDDGLLLIAAGLSQGHSLAKVFRLEEGLHPAWRKTIVPSERSEDLRIRYRLES